MSTSSMISVLWRHIGLLLAVGVICALAFYAWHLIRTRRKHDALCAQPLNLDEEQERQVVVRYRHRPYRMIFVIPAALVTDEVLQGWVEAIGPRLGRGLSAGAVKVIPQRLWRPSLYEVTFTRLDDLRNRGGGHLRGDDTADRYALGREIGDEPLVVSIPRLTHLAVIGESNSGKGSVIANIIMQEVAAGGEVSFIDLKGGMEAANYIQVLAHKAYTLDEAEKLLEDFNNGVDERAKEWRGKVRALGEEQARHRLLVIDEAADLIKGGALKKQSDRCIELIRSILSRSRALNCTVVVATQNPRVSTSLPYRSLLLTTLALRLNSKSEAVMALGEDAVKRGARPWQISFNRPGDGYLWDAESNSVHLLHVPFVSDEQIHELRLPDAAQGERSVSESSTEAAPSTWSDPKGATTTPPWEMRDKGGRHE